MRSACAEEVVQRAAAGTTSWGLHLPRGRMAGMAKRIENPDADDLGLGGVEFSPAEFETFLEFLASNGIGERQIAMIRNVGFIAPIKRGPGFEWAFQMCKMQADVKVLAICREGCYPAMAEYIVAMHRNGTWPIVSD